MKLNCKLCKEELDTSKDKCTHIEDWDNNKKITDVWVHIQCFKKGMNRDLTALEKQAQEMLGKAGRIFNSEKFKEMFPNKREEYIIK